MSGKVESVEFDFLGRAMIEDPYPAFELLRAQGDVVWSPRMRSWLVVGHEATRTALASPDAAAVDAPGRIAATLRKASREFPAMLRLSRHLPTFLNGADHMRLRRALGASLGAFRDRFAGAAKSAAERLLQPIAAAGEGDLGAQFASLLHGETAGALMGVPPAERSRLSALAEVSRILDDAVAMREYAAAERKIGELTDFMRELLQRQRGQSQPTILLDLASRFEPDPLDEPDLSIATAATGLLILGRDTVAGALTLALKLMLDRHGGQLAAEDLRFGPDTVEELVRITSSVQYGKRQAIADLRLGEAQIKAGDHLLILIAAADRDPHRFPEPDQVCPHATGHSLAFGHGSHSCIGAPLARVEIAAAFEALGELPGLIAVPGRSFGRSRLFRGLAHLPVRIASPRDREIT